MYKKTFFVAISAIVFVSHAHALTGTKQDCEPANGKTLKELFADSMPQLNAPSVKFELKGEGFSGWTFSGTAVPSVFKPDHTVQNYAVSTYGGVKCTYKVLSAKGQQVGSMLLDPADPSQESSPTAPASASASTCPGTKSGDLPTLKQVFGTLPPLDQEAKDFALSGDPNYLGWSYSGRPDGRSFQESYKLQLIGSHAGGGCAYIIMDGQAHKASIKLHKTS